MGKTELVTKNGYVEGEVISALQKEIRRGHEESALFWALELCPQFENHLWKRLVVIVNEDIGLANPPLLMLVPSQKQVYFELRSTGAPEAKLVLTNTILAMSRSPKSRLADHCLCAVAQAKLREHARGCNPPIPDYALDKHTARGRSLGRGFDHWLEHGTQLHPESDVPDPYAERAQAYWREGTLKDEWPPRSRRGKHDDEPEQGLLFS